MHEIYRYRILTGEVATRVRELVREIGASNYIEINYIWEFEPGACRYISVDPPPNISLSKAMQYIKGKSSRKVMMEFEHLRKRYWGQHIWQEVILQ